MLFLMVFIMNCSIEVVRGDGLFMHIKGVRFKLGVIRTFEGNFLINEEIRRAHDLLSAYLVCPHDLHRNSRSCGS